MAPPTTPGSAPGLASSGLHGTRKGPEVSGQLADAAAVADGKLYVMGGGWDTLMVSHVPIVHPRIAVALVFRFPASTVATKPQVSVLFRAEAERSDELGSGVAALSLAAEVPPSPRPVTVPMALNIDGFHIPDVGSYRLELAVDDELVLILPLHVVHPEQPSGGS